MRDFAYDFAGLKVCSPFPLPGLRPFRGDEDVRGATVRLSCGKGSPPGALRPLFRWQGRYGLALRSQGNDFLLESARHGSFLITEAGRSITCFPGCMKTSSGTEETLVRRILPRIVQLHGGIALHGAALSDGQAVFLLLGDSKAGKSTLAAVLSRELGWKIFSDDTSILGLSGAPAVVSPSTLGVCLRQDSLSGLNIPRAEQRRLLADETKYWHCVEDGRTLLPQRIQAFLWLKTLPTNRDTVEFNPIPGRDSLFVLIRQLVRFNPTDRALEARLFQSLSELAAAIPMYALAYPRGFEKLRNVAEQIQGVCRQASERSDGPL